MAQARIAAKTNKDYARADELRDQITAAWWSIKDTAEGYEFHPL
jgi:cysteinyl-tRNA synthetase